MMSSMPPDGFADESSGPPDGFADDPTTPAPSIGQNAISDVKDIVSSGIDLPKQLLIDQPIQAGKDAYQTAKGMMGGQPFSQTPVAQDLKAPMGMAKDIYSTAGQYARHPVASFQEHPVKMPLNILGAVAPMADLYGAAKPILSPVGKAAADVAEKASGLTYKTPGVLREVFDEPKKLFAPGVEKARELYGETNQSVRTALSDISDHQKFVDEAVQMAGKGDITPAEALEARKSLDRIKKNVTGSYYRKTRDILDGIAKKDYAIADKVYSQGVKSDNMRQLFGVNKSGTPSLVKMGVGTLLKGAIPAFSPLFQSSAAAALGAADKAAAGLSESGVSAGLAGANATAIQGGKKLNPGLENDQQGNTSNQPVQETQGKVLTKEIAKKFLDLANGSKDLARELARRAGYSW